MAGDGELDYHGDDNIPAEDRDEVMARIDAYIEEQRAASSLTGEEFSPQRRGFRLPFLVNVFAVAAIIVSILSIRILFGARHENMIREANAYFSAEGKILEAFKREAEEKLREKELQIRNIQSQLTKLDRDLESIIQDMERKYRDREVRLQEELERSLQEERARLASLGTPQEQIESQLQSLEKTRKLENDRELQQYQREIEALREEMEEALLDERKRVALILEETNRDREKLQEELLERERELTLQFKRERVAFESETSVAEQRFHTLSKLREREQLIIDQINASYDAIIENIENDDNETAARGLVELRGFILDPSLESVPAVAKRRDIELFIIDSLLQIVSTEDAQGGGEDASLLLSLRDTIISADRLYEEGRYDAARTQYYRAVEEIVPPPAFKAGGRGAPSPGDMDRAIERYKETAPIAAPDNHETVIAALEIIQNSLRRIEYSKAMEGEIVRVQSGDPDQQERHAELERKLQSLIEIEERERGVSERIVAYYESIMDDINDREYVSARHGLEELRSLVLDDAVASLPSIDRRRSVDLHVIDYLEETLKDRPLGHGTPRRLDSDSLDLARESDPSNPPTSQTRARTENQQQAPGSRSTVHLLGVLSSVSGNEAVVEPLIDIPVQYGSQVLIRRNATPELRMDIAVAEIHEVAPGRLMVVILEVFDSSERPRETDLVYTLSQKS